PHLREIGGAHVELEHVAAAADDQRPGLRCEADRVAVHQDMTSGEGRVAAKLDLARWRKPAQVVIGVLGLARHGEGGLTEIVLGGDRLHHRVFEPALERHNRRRVARQRPAGEGVDLEEGEARQPAFSVISDGSSVSRSIWPSGSTWIRISVFGKRFCSASSTRSSRSWASFTVHSGGTQTWNCAKLCVPLVRVRKSWRPASSGYSLVAARKRSRKSSGHSLSISWSRA